ncbi:MAG: tRNA 4-thiouridine(8) synthase ThiI [Methanobrevibacter sp.]|jgi:thiamine biosynthesis protein ThiI|nr:tRNA 4-thiouridine(8) synthase ThiI [Methanobrevibacter sp.]
MEDVILIRYGELNTKGKNRKLFIDCLKDNIKKKLDIYPDLEITAYRDRTYIFFKDYDENKILSDIKDVFGIQSFSLAKKVSDDYQVIEDTVMESIDFNKYKTFKVLTRRGDKSYPMISDEINRSIATRVLNGTDLKVDVHNYGLGINIDIRSGFAYIFSEKINGAGGFPVGISGKGLLMLSGGIDSPVAGYLAMKRGVKIECIHFASPPYTSKKALHKVLELVGKYLRYDNEFIVYNIPFTKLQLEINNSCDNTYSMTISRRMMYRIADRLCEKQCIEVIVNGESIAQVASQTLQSMVAINNVTNRPIIRPCVCLDKIEIIDMAKKIDTYETSILPYEDCCTIFLPPHPIIAPKLENVLKNENKFDYESLLDECLNNIERIVINSNNINEVLDIEEENLF